MKLTAIKLIFILVFSLTFFSGSISNTSAQTITGSVDYSSLIGPETLDVDMSPQFPEPNSSVTLRLTNYSTDLNRAKITWSVNGAVLKSGVGEKNLSITVGDVGKITSVKISIITAEGLPIEKTVNINPTKINLMWEAKTYTPPFYKGRADYSYGSVIKFIAVPHFIQSGKQINSKNLVYKWRVNGNVLQDYSGYGKDVAEFQEKTFPKILRVEVEVVSMDKSMKSEKSLSISPGSPEVLLYENSPLYGYRFEKAISNYDLALNEVTLAAFPYFFSAKEKNSPNIEYSWKAGGETLNLDNPSEVTFSRKPDDSGTVNISVSAKNLEQRLQSFMRDLKISYE